MKLPSILFICSNCDAQSPKWAGRCLECGQWGTLQEGSEEEKKKPTVQAKPGDTVAFSDIKEAAIPRFITGIGEIDQVLGGGIVPGSLILLGGEPGIGKSTVQLQIACALSQQATNDHPIIYASGEESAHQVKMRFDRLKNEKTRPDALLFMGETNCEKICATLKTLHPLLAIVDSIQTIASNQVPSEAGNISQVRACTVKLLEVAKQENIPIIITGHVTKEGMVAGPKTLEHLVDTVLYLEGDNNHYFRLLKTAKNRFGSTNEVGLFEMTQKGLQEVTNPSQIFLSETQNDQQGTVTTALLEGSRVFLIQVQALTSKTYFGYPQRKTAGFDINRLGLLTAVLSKRLGLNLGDQDIHINVVGGIKISETSADLAICASIISAYTNKPLPSGSIVLGEVGLGGEIRPCSQLEKRLKEAEKLGFTQCYIPFTKEKLTTKLNLIKLKNIKELEL